MKSLDLAGLEPGSRAIVADSLKGATLAVEGGKLRLSAGADLPPGVLAMLLGELEQASCRGVPDGLYTVGGSDVVDQMPVANPFIRGTGAFNLTAQIQMQQNKPELAARCRAAATTEVNPWSKAGFNVTAQFQMTRDNPEQAARLKATAGR